MEKTIRCRHCRKLLKDRITENHNIDNKKRKNRRFSKKRLINKKKLKRKGTKINTENEYTSQKLMTPIKTP